MSTHAQDHVRDHAHDHADACCAPITPSTDRFRIVLWVALAVNLAMFVVEVAAGLAAGSSALQADAVDFLGDAANYGISLMVLGLAMHWRSSSALLKGVSMSAFGLWVIGVTLYHAMAGTLPRAEVMGAVGLLALAANVGVAVMLYAYRHGDANMRSVWLCTRNDALSNLAVLAAALGVYLGQTGWPDLAVAALMAALALRSGWVVMRASLAELRPA
jgi:Co/Zn/Cd efflux system component